MGASLACISGKCGASRGASPTTVASSSPAGTPLPDHLHDLFQQDEAGNILVGRVLIREVAAQVAGPHRAQEGVANGVAQDVGVGVAQEPQMRECPPPPGSGGAPPQTVGVIPRPTRTSSFSPLHGQDGLGQGQVFRGGDLQVQGRAGTTTTGCCSRSTREDSSVP